MPHTNTTWDNTTKITTTNLDNLGDQYDDALGDATVHNHDTRYYTRTECDAWFWYAGNDGPGSGCDADLLYYAGANKHYADFGTGGVAAGTVIMWKSAVLPSGWVECDGTNGTNDLRDCFVMGAGSTYTVGQTGGGNIISETYNLTIAGHALTSDEMPSHRHSVTEKLPPLTATGTGSFTNGNVTYRVYSSQTSASSGSGGSHGHTGSTVTINNTENKPPCVALKYIQKT